jgi:uncharacterized membrane protein
VAVTIRLLETIAVVLEGVTRKEDAEALLRQAAIVHREAETAVSAPEDRDAIEERYRRVRRVAAGT